MEDLANRTKKNNNFTKSQCVGGIRRQLKMTSIVGSVQPLKMFSAFPAAPPSILKNKNYLFVVGTKFR